MNITVLGAGAWGTALAGHLATHHDTLLWTHDVNLVAELTTRHENKRYLKKIILPSTLHYETDLNIAIKHSAERSALCIAATPVSGLRALCSTMRVSGCIPEHIIWVCKGFEADTQLLPHQIVTEELPTQQSNGVLSGPSFAYDVAQKFPVELVIASISTTCQQCTIDAFHHGTIRIYTSNDIIGVEIGGAVKNVIAIAIGIADGLSLGLSARATLITHGLEEISRFGVMLGGYPETFIGLTGLGDLVLTATSDMSRNRTVGFQLAKGQKITDILSNLGHIPEGVYCAQTVLTIARDRSIDMPIIDAICGVLFGNITPKDAIYNLLNHDMA
ncbi:MAG: NAD(P)H-dependent glycerol-3-phosphate dehydrogenase [Burkholderia sp.]|nr:NAD(P)H-dependent glycerol-3-phosphate dehydrogenase [Burkholderia sp.]